MPRCWFSNSILDRKGGVVNRKNDGLLYQFVQLLNECCRREVWNVGEIVVTAVIRHNIVYQNIGVKEYPFHRSMMCAKCSSCAISSSVMFTMPRNFLKSAGTCLLCFGFSIDSLINVITMCFCSSVIPLISPMNGAIGVSLILCANAVMIL